jgi:hypothetical protein
MGLSCSEVPRATIGTQDDRAPCQFGNLPAALNANDNPTTGYSMRMVTNLRMLMIVLAIAASGCSAQGTLKPFTSDGCSLFPDRSLISSTDWCDCCVTHDLAYWRGGSAEERARADHALRACVHRVTGNDALADVMYAGVRAGGGPYFFTPYRWAYGWPFGRNYTPLTAEETAEADQLARQHGPSQAALACRKRSQ